METKHTQGKWHLMEGGFKTKSPKDPNLITIYATNDDLEIICQVRKDDMLVNKVQDFKANAKLIACAPEMLEKLEKISKYLDEIEKTNNFKFISNSIGNEDIKQLIKKATE